MDTQNKVAVITGGSGYLGQSITKLLLEHGWKVAILSRSKKDIEGAQVYECDITNEAAVKEAIQKITTEHGLIAACIHAASPMLARKPIADLTIQEAQEQMDVAFLGAFLLAKYATPQMSEDGVFIGITSGAIEPGASPAVMGTYVAAKSALRGFLRSLSKDMFVLAKSIRVYAVAPGFMPGGLNSDLAPALVDFISQKSGNETPEDAATVILDVLEKPEHYPTGSSIRVSTKIVSDL